MADFTGATPSVETPAAGPMRPAVSAHGRLEDVKKTIWLTRPDLRALCKGNRERFEWWLILNGKQEYRALAEDGVDLPVDLLTEAGERAISGMRPVLTRFMQQVWTMRPDLHEVFAIDTLEGQEGFVWWYFLNGVPELKLARYLTEDQKAFLSEPDPRFPQGTLLPLTRLMLQLWHRRPDLQQAFPLDTPAGYAGFVGWCYTAAQAEPGLEELFGEIQKRIFRSPALSNPSVPRIMMMVWSGSPALQARFPEPASPAFHEWALREGQGRVPALQCLADATTPVSIEAPAVSKQHDHLSFGVNLIGYARGQFGIGEDVRMAALAMQAAGVPFSVYNVEPGREVCQGDDSLDALINDQLPYAVNLLCTTGIETARLAAVEGSAVFDGRRTIGYWPWELPEWPEDWHHAYDLVDEVWASSRYTYEAFSKSSPKPVRHMPMAVTVEATTGLSRRDFRLPADRFLFVFSFDVLSSLSRKNPQACVRAFKEAFPLGQESVGLVVKAMRATPDNPVWHALLEEARADQRIMIISETLTRGAVLDLYRACNAFVSLHRAEGFGRGIAEAMMLGKPVLVTSFSGNMDFTTQDNAALVDYKLRPVSSTEYPFAGGQLWAEPDIAHAAWWMQRIFRDHVLCGHLAEQGKKLTTATYLPEVVGAGYAALLCQTVE